MLNTIKSPHFYAVIIGTEILNGRRVDKHFAFVQNALKSRGHELYASLLIKDDEALIASTFEQVRSDPQAVMFSFGGIGSTPDDLTREIAARVFTGKPVVRHKVFEQDIIDRFGDEAYPHRIHMSDLPENSGLLKNPVNNMSGFFLDERYFFMPGFPEMSHPMVKEALERFYPSAALRYRKSLKAKTSENTLIHVMKEVPPHIELSSLPVFIDGEPNVEISVAAEDIHEVEVWFKRFTDDLDTKAIVYKLL
jgi:molybdopterin-biosynthesis enzyme MoeA-like protein